MGMMKRLSSYKSQPTTGNPDPERFAILESVKVGAAWVSLVRYDGCVNFEGNKILVTNNAIKGRVAIDPHFSPANPIGLIARFEPTPFGMQLAKRLATLIEPKE